MNKWLNWHISNIASNSSKNFWIIELTSKNYEATTHGAIDDVEQKNKYNQGNE